MWSVMGAFLISGTLTGILIPVLSKDDKNNDDTKSLINKTLKAKSETDAISAMQALYGLKQKTTAMIKKIPSSDLKTKYQSADKLGKFIFTKQKTNQITFKINKEKTTNLQEILITITAKDKNRKLSSHKKIWPQDYIDKSNDNFAVLLTFFKKQVVKIIYLLPVTNIENQKVIFFKLKSYDMVQLFYKFKNANPQASDFKDYNAFLDDEKSTKGLAIFKTYLLSLKTDDSKVKLADLKDTKFIKVSHNTKTMTATAKFSFSYQGLSISKEITDFKYQSFYKLSFKSSAVNKIADEIIKADINTAKLPKTITIKSIMPSLDNPDGSVIKITFNGGKIRSQELDGLVSYNARAKMLLSSATTSDFTSIAKSDNLPSEYNDKTDILNIFMTKTNSINVKKILEKIKINFKANDQTGILGLTIVLNEVSKTFTIDGFNSINNINQRIDDEVKKGTMPTIKSGNKWKTGSQVLKEDVLIVPSDNSLRARIVDVKEKSFPVWKRRLRGTFVIITIEVFSPISGSKKSEYKKEIGGFVSSHNSFFWNTNVVRPGKIKNNHFNTIVEKNMPPSKFKNIQLIRNIIKEKAVKVWSRSERELIKKRIDNNMKIILNPDDEKGILEFTTWFGTNKNTYKVSGFKKT